MSKRRFMKVCAGLFACGLAAAIGMPVAAYAALQTNYDWYRLHEADASYTISTAGHLKALAELVNGTADYDGDGTPDTGAVDFAGKTITLAGSANFIDEAIVPIGTPEHPFLGRFDGGGNTVDNFTLAIAADDMRTPVSNVGLFGYVGEGGSIANLNIGGFSSITIERTATNAGYITNVGMVAGFCAGSISNCSNAGSLAIASETPQRNAEDFMPVRNVGGVAGQCIFDVSNCSNTGAISVSETASPDSEIGKGQLVANVGGVVGLAGDETRIGTYNSHIYGEADKHGAVSACSNTGMVVVDTPRLGALDRFGQQTNAESVAVGGVVGYSQGSVTGCTNGRAVEPELGHVDRSVGYIRAENGVHVGGICGSLRGVLASNTSTAWADDGADGNDPLVISDCTNYGDIYGRVDAGGIAGKASSFTTITECLTLNKADAFGNPVDTFVVATRWNKPSPGGIVGIASGEVSYCANFATVASAMWADEANRTLKTQDGYYAAGIAGMLTYFDDRAPANGGVTTPIAELFGCYNAGTVVAGAGMRQRGIVGQNDGYVHDNVLLSGVVDDDKIVYGDDPTDKEASGVTGENRVYTAKDLRGDKSAEAVAFLNANSLANDWERYWIVARDATAKGQNGGFPLLDRQNPWGDDAVSIADANLTLVSDAAYTGGESLPDVRVTLPNGTVLTSNADYRVIPQAGATEPTADRPYVAHVVGLGRYVGTSTAGVAYGIVAGDMSRCTVTVVAHTFDFEPQKPTAADVTVRTPAGTVVDPDGYTFAVLDVDDNEIEPVNAGSYRLVVSPKEGSALFTGTLEGTFRIKPASFMREVKFDGVTISYLGKTYKWVDSTEAGESDNPSTTLPYTGVPVKPAVGNIVYNGHTLVEGVDYKVVYGNANSDEGNTGSEDENNLGIEGGRTVGCITVRYISGGKANFSSYANMFFNIVDDGSKVNLSEATYEVDGEQVADGDPLEPVELYLGSARLREGTDYTIEYADNVAPGTATFVATGIGRFEGTLSGSFEISSRELITLLYAFSGSGTDADPYEATVAGVEYHGNRDRFSLSIPESVEQGGVVYTVTAIGDKAFGGTGTGDFTGSLANESKVKLADVSIPASVRSIGANSFGSSSGSYDMGLETVEFAEGSRLSEIGASAFARCTMLASFTVPAQVESIGSRAFYLSGLKELRFLTRDPSLPRSVAKGSVNGAFRDCSDVVVYGFGSASAVKALVQANSGNAAGNEGNGGKGFVFVEMSPLDGAVVSAIADQLYTGDAIEPALSVSLGGVRLAKGTDYTVSYEDNVAAGTARAVVAGIGRWGGTVTREFTITRAKMGAVEFSSLGEQPFNGEPVSLVPRLTYLNHSLVDGRDYVLSYADGMGNAIDAPVQPGTYRLVATATATGSFEGAAYRMFRIVTPSIADAAIDNIGQREYTGAAIEPSPNVCVGGRLLVRDVDYVLSYADNVEVGQAMLTVRGIGSYAGEQEVGFRITRASLEDAVLGGVGDVQATGEAALFDPVVVLDGVLLASGTDYAVSYEKAVPAENDGGPAANSLLLTVAGDESGTGKPETAYEALDAAPSEAGDYRLVVKGMGRYAGSAAREFSIVERAVAPATDLSAATVVLDVPAGGAVYTGAAQKPWASVTLNGTALVEGRDYVVSYRNNVMPSGAGGQAVATVHGIGAYKGFATIGFPIAAATITNAGISSITGAEYVGGDEVRPALAVKVGGRSLVEDVDYTVSYAGNTAVGVARATVTGIGGYEGTGVRDFSIVPADISRATVSAADQTYDGTALKPAPSVTLGGRVLVEGVDYTVSYEGNTGVGEATVIVTGRANYRGTAVGAFPIAPRPIAGARIIVASQTYTGKALTPEVTVRVGNTVLGPDDFGVSYSSNTNAGRATVAVTGTGNYTGTASQQFIINPADLSKAAVTLSATSLPYTGKAIKPAVKSVKVGGVVLKAGTDYTVSYSDNIKVGKSAKVKVTGKGNYTGSATKAFSIVKAANPMKVKTAQKAVAYSKVKSKAQTVKPIAVSKAKGTVSYKKMGGSKQLTVNAKTGKVTVKKGTKKGLYTAKVTVTAKGDSCYKKLSKTVTFKVRVK